MCWNSYFDANLLAAILAAQGIPPVDRAQRLYTNTVNVPLGNNWVSPIIDASGYATLDIAISETNGVTGSVTVPRNVHIDYYADPFGFQWISADEYWYWPSGGSLLLGPLPTRGPYVQIRLFLIGVGAANGSATIEVTGSVRTSTIQRAEFVSAQVQTHTDTTMTGDPGVWVAKGNYATGTTYEYPTTYAGPATFGWNVGAVGTASSVYLNDSVTLTELFGVPLPVSATGQRGQISIILPLHPVIFGMTNGQAGALYGEYSLVMDGAR